MKKLAWLFCLTFVFHLLAPRAFALELKVDAKAEMKSTKKSASTAKKKTRKKAVPFHIQILGDDPIVVAKGSTFIDPGAVAHGPLRADGPITFMSADKVDTNVVGPVTLTYARTTRLGTPLSGTRVVIVEAPASSKSSATPMKTATPVASPTPSASPSPSKKFSERSFQIGIEEHVLNSVNFDPLPMGFGITPSWNVGQKVSMQVNFVKQLALKASYDFGKMGMEAKTYGSSLDSEYIANQAQAELKVYPIDSVPGFLPYVGFGAAYAQITGNYSVGGFQFPRTGDGWTWVVDIGSEFPVADFLAFSASYQIENIPVVTSIPGVGDLSTSLNGSLQFGLVARPF
jgi:opacity protein-like surface antigen